MNWCVIKKTKVVNEQACVPRPKLTRQVLLIASKAECQLVACELSKSPRNQSTEDIEVTIYVERYKDQKDTTSSRPGNGQR